MGVGAPEGPSPGPQATGLLITMGTPETGAAMPTVDPGLAAVAMIVPAVAAVVTVVVALMIDHLARRFA